jgi:hypothetical protein
VKETTGETGIFRRIILKQIFRMWDWDMDWIGLALDTER